MAVIIRSRPSSLSHRLAASTKVLMASSNRPASTKIFPSTFNRCIKKGCSIFPPTSMVANSNTSRLAAKAASISPDK
eukprot:CAMPEP_0202019462 /NCGR_PEP_ID=MMETSP0905-20130828/42075_1 /ASSEMBLY_ACC=CAM_ASM_000554 /TAXON_ID=420261 /ORGANISM="Thalassiosira antarctica, Strain CCMP982" /LENGTH=76 /DNA_ID=CAMNT_0048580737 /DNA_START=28 /DNA_END=258 /DNA_ORIENTATION=-